ncbi:MAG: hypothetical protein ABMA15_22395 [Vicinamibacterales bacterium]
MFFTVGSGVMLAGVLIGFAPTFFLRPAFLDSPLPLLLVVHGIVMTAWHLMLPAQSYLAETRRLRWHRPLGWASVAVAVLIMSWWSPSCI